MLMLCMPSLPAQFVQGQDGISKCLELVSVSLNRTLSSPGMLKIIGEPCLGKSKQLCPALGHIKRNHCTLYVKTVQRPFCQSPT